MVKDTVIKVCFISKHAIGEVCGIWHHSRPAGILGLSHPASSLRAQVKVEVLPFEDCSIAKVSDVLEKMRLALLLDHCG